jgi:uncharacterized protein YceK
LKLVQLGDYPIVIMVTYCNAEEDIAMISRNAMTEPILVRLASGMVQARTGARWSQLRRWMVLLAIMPLSFAVGCATVAHHTVPKELVSEATALDTPDIRAWGDTYSPGLQRSLVESIRQARAIDPRGVVDATGAVSVLALSGGGANGAFGAGLLKGWTESGTRPVFKLVTGISTGALIAPFAFLGSGYDATLEDFYTTITTEDIYRERSYFSILFDPSSMTDTTPLQKIVA